jgi:excisionase family DNA binding protein
MGNERGDLSIYALLEQLAARVAKHVLDGLSRSSPSTCPARLLSVEQAAVYLGRTKEATQQLISGGKLPTVRSDRRVFLDIKDLDRFIDTHKEAGIK